MSATLQQLVELQAQNQLLAAAIDIGWTMTSAGFVFAMQIGLGLLEIGSTRRKNSSIVWYKILLNLILTTWWWWILGFAWAFGDSFGVFLGAERFYAGGKWNEPLVFPLFSGENLYRYPVQYYHFVWRVATASLATSIVTAILAERITLKGVVFFNIFFNLITLPFVYAWTFGRGFLIDDIGYRDFAGTFSVFGVAAFAGLAGLLFIKPRYNRYGRWPVVVPHDPRVAAGVDLRPVGVGETGERNLPSVAFDKLKKDPVELGGAPVVESVAAFSAENIIRARKRVDEDAYEGFGVTNYGILLLGAIIFFIGFIFFNAGATTSLVSVHYGWSQVSAANTIIGGAGAGIIALFFIGLFGRKRPTKDNAALFARAIIAGIVANSAALNQYIPWEAFVVGILGAVSYLIMAWIIHRAQLDDPTEFFAIFGGAAIGGIFSAAFFNTVNGIFYDNATEGEIVLYQMLGLAILILWTLLVNLIGFWLLKVTKTLRVSLKTEIVGYDYIDAARHLEYDEDLQLDQIDKKRK